MGRGGFYIRGKGLIGRKPEPKKSNSKVAVILPLPVEVLTYKLGSAWRNGFAAYHGKHYRLLVAEHCPTIFVRTNDNRLRLSRKPNALAKRGRNRIRVRPRR